MAEIGDTIGLDYFEGLDPDVKKAVQLVRGDLRALDLDLRGRRPRKGGRVELLEQLTAHQPEFYNALEPEVFERLILLADAWDATEQIIAEKEARRAAEHPDGIGNTTAKGVRKADVDGSSAPVRPVGRALPGPDVTGNVTGQSHAPVTRLSCTNSARQGA